jgi:2,4-dienoyl-CoA reductase-like NADH-dependent reductase (Old Yellow Enzyme family)
MASALFSPFRLADLALDNRIVISPMCQYSADDGVANDWHVSHLGMLANSGAGLVIIEATHVERPGRITNGCLGLYSDHCEAALTHVIDHCHRIGTAKFGIQLAHAGRKASAQRPWEGGAPLAQRRSVGDDRPSAIPFGRRHTPRACRLISPACAGVRVGGAALSCASASTRSSYAGARLPRAQLHVAVSTTHRPLRRLVREPRTLAAG